ncbi:hypothetical protein EST38_g8302 [Candolleomyces aberdarensis]|uniref:Uncharacterized protein n=1 Tax=Candolleomyces aberdarensis TaxID=2316362 RepID=A0A4Q2DFQ5_9AGAR|nr:hypothetical protein EST38_g8302 [Candolleomyces aberdarensis]
MFSQVKNFIKSLFSTHRRRLTRVRNSPETRVDLLEGTESEENPLPPPYSPPTYIDVIELHGSGNSSLPPYTPRISSDSVFRTAILIEWNNTLVDGYESRASSQLVHPTVSYNLHARSFLDLNSDDGDSSISDADDHSSEERLFEFPEPWRLLFPLAADDARIAGHRYGNLDVQVFSTSGNPSVGLSYSTPGIAPLQVMNPLNSDFLGELRVESPAPTPPQTADSNLLNSNLLPGPPPPTPHEIFWVPPASDIEPRDLMMDEEDRSARVSYEGLMSSYSMTLARFLVNSANTEALWEHFLHGLRALDPDSDEDEQDDDVLAGENESDCSGEVEISAEMVIHAPQPARVATLNVAEFELN